MKISVQQILIPGLAVLCGLSALLLLPAVHLPRSGADSRMNPSGTVPSPGVHLLEEPPPSMREVAAKHLFVMQRKATGQNAFPDLAVKGVFLGNERSAVFSLKSKPQANLRVWEGNVSGALNQIKDPRDPRQPIAAFLREWDIKEIGFAGVTVKHFITGEVETYAVDYTPLKKVQDDAARGYGQGIIPQETGERTSASRTAGSSRQPSAAQAATPLAGAAADRISAMVQQMTPEQRRQFLQRLQQTQPSGGQPGQRGDTQQQPSGRTSGTQRTGSGGQNAPGKPPNQTPQRTR